MIGKELGSYRVTGKLGEGGMGVVYAAEHTVIGKVMAIKVLHARMCESETVVARFFNEARATSAIRHPGIVEVFDFGHDVAGNAYLVMELLDGESLKARLRRDGQLGWEISARLGGQIARALAAAHERGITHRDLKPDNLFLVPDSEVAGGERVKILDFGICKLTTQQSNVVTQSGAVIGTPLYMAPEQCRGSGEVDHRADLYSVGCILYEMVCGVPPFNVPGHGEMLAKHMFSEPDPPREHTDTLPTDFERIIVKLLAKRPGERFLTADGLAAALDAVAVGRPLPIEQAPAARGARPPNTILGPKPHLLGPKPHQNHPTTLGGATGETRHLGEPRTSRFPRRLAAITTLGVVAVGAAIAVGVARKGGGVPESRAGELDAGVARTTVTIPAAADAGVEIGDGDGRWIRVTPPEVPVLLGVTPIDGTVAPGTVGFHPERAVFAPTHHFDIHAYEVTWAELDPWLAERPSAVVHRPQWARGAAAQRAALPATGVTWRTAYDYCRSIGARLPSEAEWEYAARGPGRRPYSWGDEQVDLSRTHVFAGPDAVVAPARSADQDRTPGDPNRSILGLMGNAREWTADLWRENRPGLDESWVQTGDSVYRAVRGMPLAANPPDSLPREGAAYRDALCAADGCLAGHEDVLARVGFRCARVAR